MREVKIRESRRDLDNEIGRTAFRDKAKQKKTIFLNSFASFATHLLVRLNHGRFRRRTGQETDNPVGIA